LESVFERDDRGLIDAKSGSRGFRQGLFVPASSRISRIAAFDPPSARAPALECAPAFAQCFGSGAIPLELVTLECDRTVPREAECFEGAQDAIGTARPNTWSVEVFDANPPLAAAMARIEKAAERGNQ